MNRVRTTALTILLALGIGACGERSSAPDKLGAKEKEIIETARRAVVQYEDWADLAEYKIQRHGSGWQVTAWKVVHPEARGNLRYVPWGRSTIVIDERGKIAEYRHGK